MVTIIYSKKLCSIDYITQWLQCSALGAVHKWRQHFLGSLTPLGAYVSLSSAFGLPLGASNWRRHLWTAPKKATDGQILDTIGNIFITSLSATSPPTISHHTCTNQPWVHAKQLFNLISPARSNSNFNLKGKHLKIPLARIFMKTSKGFIFNFCKCTEFGNYISEATIIKYKIQQILPQSNLD